jgi:hypothetical protein
VCVWVVSFVGVCWGRLGVLKVREDERERERVCASLLFLSQVNAHKHTHPHPPPTTRSPTTGLLREVHPHQAVLLL